MSTESPTPTPTPTPTPAPATAPAPTEAPPRSRLRRVLRAAANGTGWLLHWWPGALLALVLALALLLAGWAQSVGSFQQAMRWAQVWATQYPALLGQLTLRLDPESPPTRLLEGGHIAHISWARDGLNVTVDDLTLTGAPGWGLALLHGDGVQVQTLRAARVAVRDERPAATEPTQPLENLSLPLPLSLPFEVGQIEYQAATRVSLGPLRGHYTHDRNGQHHLRLDELGLAQGRYHGAIALDGKAPMALQAELQGALRLPQWPDADLQVRAQADGTLAGMQAQLQIQASLDMAASTPRKPPHGQAAPQAHATATVRPWAPQPLHRADAQVAHLDLATLWPAAPHTALSGTLLAQPQADGADTLWTATADIRNVLPGPWDQQRLPLEHLQARVRQTGAQQWHIDTLKARVAQGDLQGQGHVDWATSPSQRQAQGHVTWSGFQPAALLSSLPPDPLNLTADASGTGADSTRLTLSVRPATRRGSDQPLTLRQADLQGEWQGERWTLERLRVELPQAQLTATGRWDSVQQRGASQGTFSAPGTQAQWNTDIAPDSGRAQLSLQVPQAERLQPWLQRLVQAMAPAGAWPEGWSARGAGNMQIDWQGGWQPALRWWTGDARTKAAEAAATASPTARWRRLAAQAALPLSLQLQLPTLSRTDTANVGRTAPSRLSGATLGLVGTDGRWRLSMKGQLDHLGHSATLEQAWTLWADPSGPRLTADHLQLDARLGQVPAPLARWRILNPAPLTLRWTTDGAALDAGALELLPTALGNTPLALQWDNSRWTDSGPNAGLHTSGSLAGLPLRWLDQAARTEARPEGLLADANLQGDMVFDAQWTLHLPREGTDGAQASVSLARRSGDLALKADPNNPASGPLPAGVSQALLGVQLQGRDISAQVRWESQRAGQVDARVRTEWQGGLAQPEWPAQAPLSGSLKAMLPQVGLWSVLAPPGWRLKGSLQADAALAGTRAAPQWSGQLRGDDLALRSLVDGIEFVQGQLRARLQGEQLDIEQFSIAGPGGVATGGKLLASGSASWQAPGGGGPRQPVLKLQAKAEQLRVSVRADRRLTVSGNLQADLLGKALQLRGKLLVDQAAFVLPDQQTPRLGDDVVVRGSGNAPVPTGERVVPDIQIQLGLGNSFQIRGHGLDTRLAGDLELRSTPSQPAPRVFGEVRTERGTYRAYGQRLDIEQGVLRFAGPYDNPALDVLAIRPFTSQRVGVQIRGTAQAPQVRLYADPDLPDSEKLAWLVLGRSASGGGAEAAVLQQAAIALLSSGSGNNPLSGLFGLDEISVSGAGDTTTNASGETVSAATVTLGKRVSNRLYVAYERSLVSTLGTLSLFYDVSKHLTLRARTGEDNAVDLIFTLPYD